MKKEYKETIYEIGTACYMFEGGLEMIYLPTQDECRVENSKLVVVLSD